MTTAARYAELMQTDPVFRARKLAYMREHNAARRKDRKAWLDALKMERGCMDCGYRSHPEALQFDHVRGDKIFKTAHQSFATNILMGMTKLLEEIAKCDVVCAICHAVRTAERRSL